MFDIQISNPHSLGIRNEDDKNMDEAIESIFPLHNEYAFIIWNHIFIPLTYKYDVSIMINDIIHLMTTMRVKQAGKEDINWASDTFSSSWAIHFDLDKVRIKATWYDVLGKVTDLLQASNEIEVPRQEFVEKWMDLLLFIKIKLQDAGYTSTNLEDFHDLEELSKDI
jgi:hypothetical protein